jgi:acyl carrier protein phosphodiesterase
LAHLLLSYPDTDEMSGNFIGDFVKGKNYLLYPPAISKGIIIHRMIDTYTDKHPAVIQLVNILRPYSGRYSGVVADILFDHVLASDFIAYCPLPLNEFAAYSHTALTQNERFFSAEINLMIQRVHTSERLQSYATTEGITEAFRIMAIHTSLPDFTITLQPFLRNNKSTVVNAFEILFPETVQYVKKLRESTVR